MAAKQNAEQEHPDTPDDSFPRSSVGAVRGRGGTEQGFVLGLEDTSHHPNKRNPRAARCICDWCHAAARKPPGKAVLGETQAAEMFAACHDPHLVGRGLHDLRRLGAANVARVRAAVATVTDDTNSARSGEIYAPRNEATATTEFDSSHFADIGNDRARSTRGRDGSRRHGCHRKWADPRPDVARDQSTKALAPPINVRGISATLAPSRWSFQTETYLGSTGGVGHSASSSISMAAKGSSRVCGERGARRAG